ncbi:MAG: hydantoinase B/oxoprolinase family protein [Alphaproteobacteria bacterium]|nr:hydantoinase B/oxoprolinase family protein [Alphaproteobacteria bacterium]
MKETTVTLDPISLALVQNRLDHVSQQMGWVMIRTSRSPIFNQSHDFSCFITDAAGVLVSQADGIPIHTGGGGFAVRALLKEFGGRIREQDVFLQNDPYTAGGNHLPDWVIARPVFVAGRLVAFACNRAHQSDIGGGAAGTYNAAATEMFHEGIRLPVLRLVEAGVMRDDLWQLLMINTRTPELLDGDLRAMLGATQIGAEQVQDMIAGLGIEEAMAYFAGILEHAHRRMSQAIESLPAGVYLGEDFMDDDCFDPIHVPIKVKITVQAERMTVDFTGTGPQVKGFKNSSVANTYSAVYTALSAFFDHRIPRNEGTFRGVRIIAPEGSVVNARAPAAMTMNTVFPAHQIIKACWRALEQGDPARSCAAWGPNSLPTSAGRKANGETFVMYHWGANSSGGAVKGRDGFQQIGPMITLGGLTIPNVEIYEQLYPVYILRHEFRCDASGAGEFRGGNAVHYAVYNETEAEYSFRAEGTRTPNSYGANGGRMGAQGRVEVWPDGGVSFRPPAYAQLHLPPNRLEVDTPAGGGWGDPLRRPPERVVRDVRDGVVSEGVARDTYGVVLAPGRRAADLAASKALRERLRVVAAGHAD